MKNTNSEQKHLIRLAGEFLVSSQLAQFGYSPALQLGNIVDYDILAFDKKGNTAFIEVKSTASYKRAWAVSSKIFDKREFNSVKNRYFAFVDLSDHQRPPEVYIIPLNVVQEGIKYHYSNKLPKSKTLRFDLKHRPQGKAKNKNLKILYDFVNAQEFLGNYQILKLETVGAP